jgi:hypothetical protein
VARRQRHMAAPGELLVSRDAAWAAAGRCGWAPRGGADAAAEAQRRVLCGSSGRTGLTPHGACAALASHSAAERRSRHLPAAADRGARTASRASPCTKRQRRASSRPTSPSRRRSSWRLLPVWAAESPR